MPIIIITFLFLLFNLVGLFAFDYQIPGIHIDEIYGLNISKKYFEDIKDLSFHIQGFTPLASSVMSYLMIPFIKLLGESINTFRFFGIFWNTLNLILLSCILKNRVEDKTRYQILALTLTAPMFFVFSKLAVELTTIVPFFILLAVYFFNARRFIWAGFCAGLALTSHPIAVIILFPIYIYLSWKNSIKAHLTIIGGIIIPCLPFLLNIQEVLLHPRLTQSYFGLEKLIEIPLMILYLFDGTLLIKATAGEITLPVFPLYLILSVYLIVRNKTSLLTNLKSPRLFTSLFSFLTLGFIFLPSMGFRYFYLAFIIPFIFLGIALRIEKRSNFIVGVLVLYNFYLCFFNIALPFNQSGGKGSFYENYFLKKEHHNKRIYQNFYFLNYDKVFATISKSKPDVVLTHNQYMFLLLDFYQQMYKNFKVEMVQKGPRSLKGKKALFITFGYDQLATQIKIQDVTFIKIPTVGENQVLIYKSIIK